MSQHLADSIKDFNAKKERCLSYIDEGKRLLAEYEKAFPPVQQKEVESAQKTLGHFSVELMDTVKEKISSSQLKILVAGQFKAGKSTLVNALLGDEVLPAYSTPCTAVITEVVYGETKKAVLSFKQNIEHVPDDINETIKRHIKQHHGNPPDFEIVSQNFEDELEDYLVIPMSAKEQKESVAESPYELCKLMWPLELFKDGVMIIDSPGLNEAKARDETTLEYVKQADMVLHVLSAQQCYGLPDKDFVEKLESEGNFPKAFLINRFDQLNKDKDREKVRIRALNELSEHSTYGQDGIFFLSAYHALEGRMNNNAEEFEKSGFPIFEKKIAEIFNTERGKIKLGGVKDVWLPMEKMAHNHIASLMTLLNEEAADLKEKYKSKESEFQRLDKRKKSIAKTVSRGCYDFDNRLRIELTNFFSSFINNQLKNIVDRTTIPDIAVVVGKKDDIKRAVQILDDNVKSQLNKELGKWQKTDFQRLYTNSLIKIREDIQDDLDEFNEDLAKLQKSMNISEMESMGNMSGGISDDDMSRAFTGAGLGGGLAGGAVFLASRFFAVLGGPVGWAITGIATVASIAIALWDRSKEQEKIKSTYLTEVRNGIIEKQGEWVTALVRDGTKIFTDYVEGINDRITKSIEDTKRPIEEAIQQLEQDSGNKEEKKAILADFQQKFDKLAKEGETLYKSL